MNAKANHDSDHAVGDTTMFFRVCPKCARAVPGQSQERYCINDGERLLERCPVCQTRITNPYGRHCATCGCDLTRTIHERKKS
jgi:hypothetical protein